MREEEKREREKRKREEEEEEKKGRREVQGEEEIRYGYVRNFGMNLCIEFCTELVKILYGYLFGGMEYLFLCRILVWNGVLVWFGCSLQWKKKLYKENVEF